MPPLLPLSLALAADPAPPPAAPVAFSAASGTLSVTTCSAGDVPEVVQAATAGTGTPQRGAFWSLTVNESA